MADSNDSANACDLKRTPLSESHVAAGARIVPFAGYEMPVQYPKGILAEHVHTREAAGLFDVSHMGQAALEGPDFATVARALEMLVPADIAGLKPGQQRYTQLLNEQGGILDDLMVSRPTDAAEGRLNLVVNAACKDADFHHIEMNLAQAGVGVHLAPAHDKALLALQGPKAVDVIARLAPDLASMDFMTARAAYLGNIPVHISRSGYTGEDGYEISVSNDNATALWDLLLNEPEVAPIGLGARDSLRLEAGLCLYGHDINQETSPVEAGLGWSIGQRRRDEGGFPGEIRIRGELREGTMRRRVGIQPEGRMPAREGTQILDEAGELIGELTSGGFGPTVNGPVAMGYVVADFAKVGTPVKLVVRGKEIAARVAKLPFVPHRYKR
jgi:aminomethyltransferase